MHQHQHHEIEMYRRPRVSELTAMPASTLYERIGKGLFTKPVKVSRRCSVWPRHEVEAINAALLRGATNNEIRVLVTQLQAARAGSAADDGSADSSGKSLKR